ncbi:MAG: DUF427 domain-containing protein [Pseudomonadota bacterium]
MALPRENVQDYPRPPALEEVADHISVHLGGVEIVSSTRALRVLETHHPPTYYVPPEDIAPDVLYPVTGQSYCEWKGHAAYFDVRVGSLNRPRAAWAYPSPTPGFKPLKDFVAFYPGAMQACFVGDVAVRPQPGDFYGGWVTENLDGLIKGSPGTLHW